MLEHQTLLLRSGPSRELAPDETAAASAQVICDPSTGQPLGIARWEAVIENSWLSWLTWPALMVHEAEDEPLVFTVQRLWALVPRWEVCDADGHRVAVVRGEGVLDRYGDGLAWLRQTAEGDCYVGWDGRELARLRERDDGRLLTFAAELRNEPIVKMALLAAVLTAAERD